MSKEIERRLAEQIDRKRSYKMSAQERAEQKLSFVYGNSKLTEESSKEAVERAISTATIPEKLAG